MSSIKRMLTISALGVLAAMAMAIPAQASDVKASCEVAGNAKVSDKIVPTIGVRLVGGKGFYTFKDLVVACVGIAKGAPAATILTVQSTGRYQNVICGTGKAQSDTIDVTASSDGQTAKWDAALSDEKYVVEFAGGNGQFWWHDQAFPKETPDLKLNPLALDPDKDGVPDEKDYDFGGEVQLGPPPPEEVEGGKPPTLPDLVNCTKAFSVAGTILFHDE